jgi:hypothetical protein
LKIIENFELDSEGIGFCLVMEYLEGMNLYEKIVQDYQNIGPKNLI